MPVWGTSTLNDPKLRDKLEYCMGDGKALIILGVENEIDPMLDPVLEKQVCCYCSYTMFVHIRNE
jgi:dynein heavy chain, axonemal